MTLDLMDGALISVEYLSSQLEYLKGVLSKNLQKPYICGREGYTCTAGVTMHTMLTHLVQLRLRAILMVQNRHFETTSGNVIS